MSISASELVNPNLIMEKVKNYQSLLRLLTWLLPAALMFLGIISGLYLVVEGEHAFGTSDIVPWGLLIAGYVLLAVTCSGLCMVSSLGHVFGIKKIGIVVQRAILLAIVVLLSGFAVLAAELGHPLRLIYVIFSPNFTSGIWWMGTIYGVYLVALIIEFWMWQTGRHYWGKIMGIVTLVLAVAATSNLGAVFGLVNARPFWNGPYWSLYVLITAIMSGFAALTILAWFLQRKEKGYRRDKFRAALTVTAKGLAVFVAVTGVFTFWKMVSSLYGGIPAKQQAALALLQGPLVVPFWVFEVGLGIILPLALIIAGRGMRINYNFAAALLALVGIIFMRYDMVIAGQLVPIANFEMAAVFEGFSTYLPSNGELIIMVGAVGFIIFTYRLGEHFLKLD